MTTTTATVATRAPGWQADPGFGIYLHIPFCRHHCHYCDFNTYEGLDDLHGTYVDALVSDIARWDGVVRPATSVFFGGGTPTLLPPRELARILDAVRSLCGFASDAEVTIEANPETVDQPLFEALRAAGFTRVSLGMQSAVPKVLTGLGRTHAAERPIAAVAEARRAGFAEVNLDLIYGSPWESDDDWIASLCAVIDAEPNHVSAYALTIEEGTPLATLVDSGRSADVDPDVQARRHEIASDLLGAAGYDRYEVSNWAHPGHHCRHNLLYWSAGDYLGFGAGAHAHVEGNRWWSVRLPREFIAAVEEGRSTRAGGERLDRDQRAGEALMLGLRLASGIDLRAFARRFGAARLDARRDAIRQLVDRGVLVLEDDRLRVSSTMTMVGDDAARALL